MSINVCAFALWNESKYYLPRLSTVLRSSFLLFGMRAGFEPARINTVLGRCVTNSATSFFCYSNYAFLLRLCKYTFF